MTEWHVLIAQMLATAWLVGVSFSYGLMLRSIRRRARRLDPDGQQPRIEWTLYFYPAAIAFGVVFLWSRPIIEPALLQTALLCASPAAAGYGLHLLRRRRAGEVDDT